MREKFGVLSLQFAARRLPSFFSRPRRRSNAIVRKDPGQRCPACFLSVASVGLVGAVALPFLVACSSATNPASEWTPIAAGEVLASIADERLFETSVAPDSTVFFSGIRGTYRLLPGAAEVEFLGANPVPVVRISATSRDRLLLVGGSFPRVNIWSPGGWTAEEVGDAQLFDVTQAGDGTVGVSGAGSTVAIKQSGRIEVDTVDVVPEHTAFWHVAMVGDDNLIALSSDAVVRRNADGVWERIVADQSGCGYLALVGNNDEFWVGGRPPACFFRFSDGKRTVFEELGLSGSRFQMVTDGQVQPDGSILMWGLTGLLLHVTRDSLRALQFPDTDYFGGAAIVGDDLIFAVNQREAPDEALIVRLKLGQLRYGHRLAR
jgi:hypothetical protein